MASVLFASMFNGFSGLPNYDYFYYSLVAVINTELIPLILMAVDQPVDYDFEQYSDEVLPHTQNNNYDPNKWSMLQLKTGSRLSILNSMGISTNKDGSTNNQCEFNWYCRDSISSRMFDRYYVFYFIWAFVGGYMQYIIAFSSLSNVIGPDGQTNDLWNTGVSILAANILTHHVLFAFDMRRFDKCTTFSFFLSLSMFMPVVILLNDNLPASPYYGNQFSVLFKSSLFHLATAMQVMAVCLPRIIWQLIDQTYWHPEFVKIKGR